MESGVSEGVIDDSIMYFNKRFKTREELDELASFCKDQEKNSTIQNEDMSVLVRIDGRAFHTFTKGLKWPNDERLNQCMVLATSSLLEKMSGTIAYTQSDEITLLIRPNLSEMKNLPFSGRLIKIATLSASIVTGAFIRAMDKLLPEKAGCFPEFDARAWFVNGEDIVKHFVWRQIDGMRNSVSNLYYLKNKKKGNSVSLYKRWLEVEELWNKQPFWYKYGVYIRKETLRIELSEEKLKSIPEKYRPTGPVERSITKTVSEDWEELTKYTNIYDILVNGCCPL